MLLLLLVVVVVVLLLLLLLLLPPLRLFLRAFLAAAVEASSARCARTGLYSLSGSLKVGVAPYMV